MHILINIFFQIQMKKVQAVTVIRVVIHQVKKAVVHQIVNLRLQKNLKAMLK